MTLPYILKKPQQSAKESSPWKRHEGDLTLSSVHAKLVETLILLNTNTNICGNQYGYQAGKGTEFCCALLNDCVAYFNEGDSPVYMCTLDAVKCFDNIWHEGLVNKLWNHMDIMHWRLLYNWYQSMRATVLLNGEYSEFFSVTKGTRQGSMLSPYLSNIFIDELMENLESCPYGIRIGSLSLNTADDNTLMARTVTDLQQLVNICYHYSCKWRFVFGPSKSKCIKMYKHISAPMESPDIWLGSNELEFVNDVEILGRVFSNNLSSQDHIDIRIPNSRRAMYRISLNNQALIVRRAGLLWSQQDFKWLWSVPLFKYLTVLEFSFILFDLCLLITFFNFIMNYVPIVTFWIFTYHKIWILSMMFCFIWSYWIIYFLACLEVTWRVVS